MKPKEFDELIRRKFDQNDFEYNPRNWDKLEDQMDGRAKKHSIMMWWLMPLAGVAASVALAVGLPSLYLHQDAVKPVVNTELSQTHNTVPVQPSQEAPAITFKTNNQKVIQYTQATRKNNRLANKQQVVAYKEEKFPISLQNAVPNTPAKHKTDINLLNANKSIATKEKDKDKNKKVVVNEPVNTFKPEEVKKQPKLSIILSGGYSQGNQNSGYTVGATIHRKLNDKVFVEGDVAFANSNIAQGMPYRDQVTQGGSLPPSQKPSSDQPLYAGPLKSKNVTYDLSYIQVSPSIGYKLIKRMSLGIGPDFQQALADNRPAPSPSNPGVNQQVPLFDVGFIGKTEYSITKNVKAGVAYRKGINNIITPMGGQFIDRDYLQFQVKCAIFNK